MKQAACCLRLDSHSTSLAIHSEWEFLIRLIPKWFARFYWPPGGAGAVRWRGWSWGRSGKQAWAPAAGMDAVEFAEKRLAFTPDETQARVLRSGAKQLILCCTRQWGKSTVAAVKGLHRAAAEAGSLILVASRTRRQSAELLRKMRSFVRRLGARPRGDGENPASLLLPNESRVVALPGTDETTRGFSAVSLLLIDEAAWVSEGLYQGLRPVLAASGGDLWLMSTPNGKQGFFHEAWRSEGQGWAKFRVTAAECGRIPAEKLAQERAELGQRVYAREYECDFQDQEGALLPRDLIEAALME
jgi:hypothetical protein